MSALLTLMVMLVVNLSDIVTLLFAWGNTSLVGRLFDVVANGVIDHEDLNVVLTAAVPPEAIDQDDDAYPINSAELPDAMELTSEILGLHRPLLAEKGDGDDPKGQPSMTNVSRFPTDLSPTLPLFCHPFSNPRLRLDC